MERIRLSKREKEVLRLLNNIGGCPDTYPFDVFASCVETLETNGLAKGAWVEWHTLESARILPKGETYLSLNPTLRNPIDWKWVLTTGISVIGTIVAIIALFIACKMQ